MNINDSFIEKNSVISDDEFDINECNAQCDAIRYVKIIMKGKKAAWVQSKSIKYRNLNYSEKIQF